MARMRDRLSAPVLLGVGAAFDFHAGLVRQAPPWMGRNGLEWAYRLSREPRRLWRRYARQNPRFVVAFARQYASERVARRTRATPASLQPRCAQHSSPGITGQDGSYLAELLLEKGYEVHGMVRRSSTERFDRIEHLRERVTLHQGDLLDQRSLVDALRASKPDEIYNLAAMSFVATSWVQPTLTADFSGIGVTRMLEAMREVCPERALLPGVIERDVRERAARSRRRSSRRSTRGPPTASRRSTGISSPSTTARATACTPPAGSSSTTARPRRGREFVERKISWHAAAIALGLASELRLGNLAAERDWGYAKDYVEAMWMMLQQEEPDDFVIATGIAHSVRECVEIAFDQAGLRFEDHVVIDPSLVRPAEVDHLVGDFSKAQRDAWLGAGDDLRGADPDDGRRRPRAALPLSGRAPP